MQVHQSADFAAAAGAKELSIRGRGGAAAPLMAIMTVIAMNRRIMGSLTLSRSLFVGGWLATVLMVVVTIAFFAIRQTAELKTVDALGA